jgi:poly(A) polymerase
MTIDDETSTPTTPVATTTEPTDTPAADAPAEAAPSHDDAPRVVDEAAWAEQNGDDEEDDEPLHFGAVADADVSAIDDEGDEGDGDDDSANDAETASMAQRPDVEVTLNENAEIPLSLIDEDALWVVKRLRAKGFEAYLTGGCVRDLLLGRTPKDFDVATAAHPNQVRAVFRNCRLVGRRFRLAHVFFPSGKVIETATFRANPTDTLDDVPEQDLLLSRDNVFGNVEEDARRRDLTINGLFYDPVAGKVLDFCNGRVDLDARLIRTIGDPEVRFQEDPVRILRAIKFATRLGFEIETNTWEAMCRHVGGLLRCAPARLQEEILRLLASTYASASWALCVKAGVPQALLPELWAALDLPATATADEVDAATEIASAPAAIAHIEAVEAHSVEAHTDTQAHHAPAAVAEPAADAVDADAGEPVEQEAVAVAPVAPIAPVAPSVATAADRHARLVSLLGALDEIRKRDADITSALAFAALVTPLFEAWQGEAGRFEAWWSSTADILAERIRLTRHDKERVPQLLQAQIDLEPQRRRGHHARATVSRPSFRESLLLLIVRLQAAQQPLDEVGAWKVVAATHNQPYQQQRMDRNRQRAAGRGAGGNERGRGRGRDRDRDRDRGRGRNGGGGGGGGRRRGR